VATGTGNGPTQTPQSTWDSITQIVNTATTLPMPQNVGNNPISWTGTYGSQSLPSNGIGLFYLKIPAGATVNTSLMTVNGAPGSTGGILIIDVGDGVTFAPDSKGNQNPLIQGDGNHPFQGSIIFYQRGTMNITTTENGGPSLEFFNQNGNQPDGLQFDSTNIANALNALGNYIFKIDAYVADRR
jgi:hypothetical protein